MKEGLSGPVEILIKTLSSWTPFDHEALPDLGLGEKAVEPAMAQRQTGCAPLEPVAGWRHVKILLASTGAPHAAERHAIVSEVIPELNELLRERRVFVEAIDPWEGFTEQLIELNDRIHG